MAGQAEILTPEGDLEVVVSGNSALSAIEEADRAHMIATARKYPRKITEFVKELTELSCYSQETAMEMMYSLPRAGKQIVGPSIRFAEAVLSCWGNSRAGVEVVDVERGQNASVTAEGRFYDCEKNVGLALRKRRRVVAKVVNGDAIDTTGNAVSSIALRDAILRSVPKALWNPIWQKAKSTAVGDAKSVAAIRSALLESFTKMGITETQVFNALGIPGASDIGADEILAMQAWKKQLNEGISTIEEIFGSPEDEIIDKLMIELGWNQTKQRMSRDQYRGRRSEHLEYLRAEVEKLQRLQPKKDESPAGSKKNSKNTTSKDSQPEQSAQPEVSAQPETHAQPDQETQPEQVTMAGW